MEAKFAELVHGADHEAMICYPFQTCDHIILKEGLVYNTLAIMIGADASRHGKRFVNGFDSMAVKGAVAKGRSSSYRLNRILKQALPHRIGSGCQLANFYVPSELNAPDDLTRDVPLRAGSGLPPWLTGLGPPPQGEALLSDDTGITDEFDQRSVIQALHEKTRRLAELDAEPFQSEAADVSLSSSPPSTSLRPLSETITNAHTMGGRGVKHPEDQGATPLSHSPPSACPQAPA